MRNWMIFAVFACSGSVSMASVSTEKTVLCVVSSFDASQVTADCTPKNRVVMPRSRLSKESEGSLAIGKVVGLRLNDKELRLFKKNRISKFQ